MHEHFNIHFTKDFYRELNSLPHQVNKRADRVLTKMIDNPWKKELQPEKIQGAGKNMYSCRVDRNFRIIWKHIKPDDILFVIVDKHDDAYRRARNVTAALDDGIVILTSRTQQAEPQAPTNGLFGYNAEKDQTLGQLFVAYTDSELLEMGVPDEVLPHVRALNKQEELWNIERLLPEEVFYKLLDLLTHVEPVDQPELEATDQELSESLDRNQGGRDIYRFIDSEEFQRALEGNLEEWMLFLAPHQRRIVNRDYAGPARVKGVVGSGKTVVAIHRLVRLARKAKDTGKKVLFLTYGNRLPNIVKHLADQLAGDDPALQNAYECRTIHSLCGSILHSNGRRIKINSEKCEEVLSEAIRAVKPEHPSFKLWRKPDSFFQEEIRYAIKGRVISSLEDYLALDRSGRGTGLNQEERKVVFEIYKAYENHLGSGEGDYQDLVLEALELVQDGKKPNKYSAVVLDEIQDLSAAVIMLIRELIPEQDNDLFMVGDGLQRIYPGGYVLGRLGIDIVGRGTLLKKNYRNTQEILQAAHAMMENETFDDLEDENAPVISPEYSVRQGEKPFLHREDSVDEEVQWVLEKTRELQAEYGYKTEDFAYLYRMRYPYKKKVRSVLAGELGDIVEIDSNPMTYFGPGAKQTTFHSAKGLEFKVVFVLGVTDGVFVPKDDWTLEGEELSAYLARERRLLYVAMTRARDQLYLTYSRGTRSRFFEDIPDDLLSEI